MAFNPPSVSVVLPAPDLRPPVALLLAGALAGRACLRLCAAKGGRGTGWSFLGPSVGTPTRVGAWRAGEPLAAHLGCLQAQKVERHGPRLPFAGGHMGYLGYEARSGIERSPPPRRSPLGFPALWLAHVPAVVAWNHDTGQSFVAGLGRSRAQATKRARALLARLTQPRGPRGARARYAAQARPARAQARFQADIERVRRAVLRGDIFQANLSQRFDARLDARPAELFARLVATQPAPYMGFLDLGAGRAVLSASPERFLRLRGRVVETDPMKGTRPRGATRAADRALRAQLEASAKERAELAMIVDLSRNDLARVCEAGSVRVSVARRLVAFARVHQAIAVVRGRLAPGRDRLDLLAAAFPPGSVTGAPKVRAMEIIDELEGEGRGPYCGALGWFDAGGDMDLAVGIRTLLWASGRVSYRVGGGITLGSDAHAEWRESLDKGRGLYAALCGREDAT